MKILIDMPNDWKEQLSVMNDARIGKVLYEIIEKSPVLEQAEDFSKKKLSK